METSIFPYFWNSLSSLEMRFFLMSSEQIDRVGLRLRVDFFLSYYSIIEHVFDRVKEWWVQWQKYGIMAMRSNQVHNYISFMESNIVHNYILNYFNFFEINIWTGNRYAIIGNSSAKRTGLGLPIGNKCTTQDRMKKDRINKIENNKIEYDIW